MSTNSSFKSTGFLDKLREFTIAQRSLAIIGASLVVAVIVVGSMWLSRPTYTPLFSGMASADASAVVDQLKSSGTKYQLTDGGTTVLVPEDVVYEERLKAAAAGLPSDKSGGYTLLDTLGVTSSEFQQDTTWRRAIEGELAATIGAMQGINVATVKLAVPSETVFVKNQAKPTASVFLDAKSGQTPNDDQVQAIVHLVSASIEGMETSGVTVVDAKGQTLTTPDGKMNTSKQQTEKQEAVRTSIQDILDSVVGPGNSRVAVTAVISSESAERTSETFRSPNKTSPLKESTSTEDFKGTGGQNGNGVLGTDNVTVGAGNGSDGTYKSTKDERTNAVDKVTESRVIPAGEIVRQTIAVAVDSQFSNNTNVGAITALVNGAAGVDADRGDIVNVEVTEFNRGDQAAIDAALEEEREAQEAKTQAELIRTAIIGGSILLVGLLIMTAILVTRRRKNKSVDVAPEPYLPRSSATPETAFLDSPTPSTTAMAVVTETIEPTPVDEYTVRRDDILKQIDRDPKQVAAHLSGLLNDKD